MSYLSRVRACLRELLVAALALGLFEAVWGALQGADTAAGYALFATALTLATAIGVAGIAALLPRAECAALALFGGAQAGLSLSPAAGVGFALALFAIYTAARRRGARDAFGLALAASLCLAFVVWPEWAAAHEIDLGRRLLRDAAQLLIGAGAVAALLAWEVARPGPRAFPAASALGLLVLVAAVFAAPLADARGRPQRPVLAPAAATPGRPTVIVLVLDTVRADRLSLYGHERDTTPQLRAFLARHPRAVLYPLAYSPATWTLPAHASLFTGTLGSEHGVNTASVFPEGELVEARLVAERTLAEVFRERGYRTGCLYANSWLGRVDGFERGFDWFFEVRGPRVLRSPGEGLRRRLFPSRFAVESLGLPDARRVNAALLDFLDACAPGPCFAVANYMDAHHPYVAPAPFAGTFADAGVAPADLYVGVGLADEELRWLEARYDEGILGLDAALGELFEQLEARGLLDAAWLVVTSDHGEAFGEHGATEHGTTVYAEVTRIPLLILPPRGIRLPPRSEAVGLLDLTATLAAAAGAEPLGGGRDLATTSPPGAVPIESLPNAQKVARHGPLAGEPARAVVVGDLKLIEHAGRTELYDVARDPAELEDLAAQQPQEAQRLQSRLPPLGAGSAAAGGEGRELSREEERRLRGLGYLP